MGMVIVPNELRDAINAKIDTALKACPEVASEREGIYQDLLCYFDKHGEIPEFTLRVPGTPRQIHARGRRKR